MFRPILEPSSGRRLRIAYMELLCRSLSFSSDVYCIH